MKSYFKLALAIDLVILIAMCVVTTMAISDHHKLEKMCKPYAYYGASQNVTDPQCGPSDYKCAVDPCR